MAKLYVIGLGPGGREHMTLKALEAIKKSHVVVGYSFYIELINDLINGKEIIKTGMKGEIERCRRAIEKVREGLDACIVSTGDSGLYGMAGPILEMANGIDVEIIPGISAAFCAASELGAPIMHDFCTISLSDLMTPWGVIEKRIECAAIGDFVVALYNPKSMGRPKHIENAVEIISKHRSPDTPVGLIKNAGRDGNERRITTLKDINYDFIDMMTVVIIGNSKTFIDNDYIITPRGYSL